MKNFREMPFVKALLVALVVLFVWGAGLPGEVVARVEMQNGHEGDPGDSYDIIGGGGGGYEDSSESPEQVIGGVQNGKPNFLYLFDYINSNFLYVVPVIRDGQLLFEVFYGIPSGSIK